MAAATYSTCSASPTSRASTGLVYPGPTRDHTNDRYRIAHTHGDITPPLATWTPATVTCQQVGDGHYRAMVAADYATCDVTGCCAASPASPWKRMATHLADL
ncbi:hypothetical protein [Verrucosispora sp. FIM060022]|uniref:hypothetical protein n=1 Tax=Verrucosispora sp. FIM060022 TaxID=1479020 RepID=UPI000F88AC8C|nr:hypothetical protein [Verrucosispora sp. FIM060022]RUL89888.1 hypothetical protein EG812_28645 [Verrucosispora sp. FIM060022]